MAQSVSPSTPLRPDGHSAPLLTVRGLSAGNSTAFQCGPVDFTLQAGKLYGLIGSNGAGKSTLLQLLSGQRQPDQGELLLDGKCIRQWSLPQRALALAYLEQTPASCQLITEELVSLALLPEQKLWQRQSDAQQQRLTQALTQAQLQPFRQRRLSSMSGGEQQRAQLCRLQLQHASLLLLDEPVNHLDVSQQHRLLTQLRQSGKTVLASFHDINLAALYCDELLVLEHGKLLCQGPVEQLLTAELVERLYQRPCQIGREPYQQKPVVFFAPGAL